MKSSISFFPLLFFFFFFFLHDLIWFWIHAKRKKEMYHIWYLLSSLPLDAIISLTQGWFLPQKNPHPRAKSTQISNDQFICKQLLHGNKLRWHRPLFMWAIYPPFVKYRRKLTVFCAATLAVTFHSVTVYIKESRNAELYRFCCRRKLRQRSRIQQHVQHLGWCWWWWWCQPSQPNYDNRIYYYQTAIANVSSSFFS